jgi:hypothetical protein
MEDINCPAKVMRIQIASDLHLELRPKQTPREFLEPGAAPLLALLGDVAPLTDPNLRAFLEWCSEHWETVIWIPGYSELLKSGATSLEAAVSTMRSIAAPYENIVILDHEGMVSSDGIYLFGLPFWKFPRDETAIWNPAFNRYVEAEPSPLDPALMRRLYRTDVNWLQRITAAQKEPIVILSHMGPMTWIQEETFVGDPDKSLVVPEIETLMRPPVVAWLCGYTHSSVQFEKEWADAGGRKGSIFLATNPRGRPFENLEYKRDAVVRLDPKLYSR